MWNLRSEATKGQLCIQMADIKINWKNMEVDGLSDGEGMELDSKCQNLKQHMRS